MQQKCGANWSEVKLCSRVQGRDESVDNSHASNFSFRNYGSPNGMQRCICLDSSLCADVSSWSEVFSNRELWAVAEIGRQDGLRIRWRKSWEFESLTAHLDKANRFCPVKVQWCGSGSVVEHLLAKEKVTGSIPVSRSRFIWAWMNTYKAITIVPDVFV